MNNNITNQMELTLNGNTNTGTASRRPATGAHRAAWWFSKMRQAVDSATSWNARTPRNQNRVQSVLG